METLVVRCVGGDSLRAAEAARALVSEGCAGLVSFGIAGGLDPALNPGSLVVAATVIDPDGRRVDADPAWRSRLVAVVGGDLAPVGGDVAGSDRPVLLSSEKQMLGKRTGAVAVDMESHAVARIAREAGVPVMVLRAIADPSTRDIPAWAPGLVDTEGRPRIRAVIAGLLAHPARLPALVRLGKDSEKAFATLRRVASTAGPLFQFGA